METGNWGDTSQMLWIMKDGKDADVYLWVVRSMTVVRKAFVEDFAVVYSRRNWNFQGQ